MSSIALHFRFKGRFAKYIWPQFAALGSSLLGLTLDSPFLLRALTIFRSTETRKKREQACPHPNRAILNHMVQYQPNLDRVFHALSDATRRDILARLDHGNLGVTDLCKDYQMSLPAVAKHVKVLQEAGLVKTAKHGRVRTVVAQPRNLRAAADWVRHYERYWNEALDRFALLAEEGQ